MASLLKDAKHTTRPYSRRFSRAKIDLDGGVVSQSFLPLTHEVCFALPSFHESCGKDDFPGSGRAERRDKWKTRTVLFTIKKDKVWLWAKGSENTKQFSFCTPNLIRDTDEHVEPGATLKNGHCDQLVTSALVSGQGIGGTYTINLLPTFW